MAVALHLHIAMSRRVTRIERTDNVFLLIIHTFVADTPFYCAAVLVAVEGGAVADRLAVLLQVGTVRGSLEPRSGRGYNLFPAWCTGCDSNFMVTNSKPLTSISGMFRKRQKVVDI